MDILLELNNNRYLCILTEDEINVLSNSQVEDTAFDYLYGLYRTLPPGENTDLKRAAGSLTLRTRYRPEDDPNRLRSMSISAWSNRFRLNPYNIVARNFGPKCRLALLEHLANSPPEPQKPA